VSRSCWCNPEGSSGGWTATLNRTGRSYQLKYAHQLFAADRATLEAAVPGDIVAVVNATGLQVGDTLHAPGAAVTFPPIPTFAPERFARVRNRDTARYKQFRSGLRQLDEEGVVHVLRRPELGEQEPIFAGVGQLQFEVARYRMVHEFGAVVTLEPAPYQLARRIVPAAADTLRNQRGATVVETAAGEPLVLFPNEHALRWAREDHPEVEFGELGLARSR
jgi:peptide chain release factor 3